MSLQPYFSQETAIEIGVDEAGRGPMFGRLYVAAVVLPKDASFKHEDMKDSKKFHSAKKIQQMAEYIRANSLAWTVQYVEADVIDEINILQSVFRVMHECCRNIIETKGCQRETTMLLIDGNGFAPMRQYDDAAESIVEWKYTTIEGGDNTYSAIAAASILAKVARDQYIEDLCNAYPELDTRYGLRKNKGYGTKQHLAGIAEHGVSQWHRRSFGVCKTATIAPVGESCKHLV
jgi:ribonuclease HII